MSRDTASWGRHSQPLTTLQRAWEIITARFPAPTKETAPPVGVEELPLSNCLGRVLAAPVAAASDYPAFDKAMMDGFAVRSADCASAGARLAVLGLVPAGGTFQGRVEAGQAVRINTGAPLPDGADAVVRIEDCDLAGDLVTIKAAVQPRRNVSRQGGDRIKGDVILTPPLIVGAAHIAAAAAAGASALTVARPVGVAIVSTGDELVPVGGARGPGQIVDSNGPMLSALAAQFGATAHDLGIARDDATELRRVFTEALRQPVVIAVGGMSMGTLDLVPQVLGELGVEWRFHGVEVRPGKPVAYGIGPQGQHVFGLPGNPVSAFVCCWLFVRMAVRALQGFPCAPPELLPVRVDADIPPHKDPRPAFIPVLVRSESGGNVPTKSSRNFPGALSAAPTRWGGSGDPFGLADANGLLFLRSPREGLPAGAAAEAILTSPTC